MLSMITITIIMIIFAHVRNAFRAIQFARGTYHQLDRAVLLHDIIRSIIEMIEQQNTKLNISL